MQTSLSAPEIARELYVSVNTVRTHTRHLYDKLGAHRRLEAIDRARAVGLLAPALQRVLAHGHVLVQPAIEPIGSQLSGLFQAGDEFVSVAVAWLPSS